MPDTNDQRCILCIQEDYEMCYGRNECEGRGGRCCYEYCCNEEYFQAFKKITCEEDDSSCVVGQ